MISSTPLLSEIMASPEDDVPRLVLADWLSERGDPWGEFIRVQCRLSLLYDGDWRAPALRARAADLLQQSGGQWYPKFRRGRLDQAWFVRGFAEQVALSTENFLRDGPALFKANPLLRGVRISPDRREMSRLCQSACLTLLKGLSFRFSRLRPVELLELAGCEHLFGLRELDLANNVFPGDGLSPLSRKSEHLRSLQVLDVSGCELSAQAMDALADSCFLPRLRVLQLGGNQLHAPLVEKVSRAAGELRVLGLSRVGLGSRGLAALGGSQALKGLKSLRLGSNRIPDRAFARFAQSENLRSLEHLDAGGNELGNHSAAILARANRRFVVLDLRNNRIQDEGALAFVDSFDTTRQLSLDLRFNPISDVAKRRLRETFGPAVRL